MSNPQLGTDELAAAQSQPEVIVNGSDRAITAAFGGEIEIDFPSNANYTLQATDPPDPDDEWAFGVIRMTDGSGILSGSKTVTYPNVDALYGGPSRLRFLFVNDTGVALTIKRSGQTGVTVAAGDSAFVQHDGTDIVAISSGGSSSGVAPVVTLAGTAYDVGDLTVGAWHEFTSNSPVTITIDDASTDDDGEWGIMATGSGGITIDVESSCDVVPPRGGSLELEQDDFAMLKRRSPGLYKLLGETVASSS
jgi:hypothetical protein